MNERREERKKLECKKKQWHQLQSFMYLKLLAKGASTKSFCRAFVNPLIKKNLWRKSFFQIMLNEVLKICQKWYLLVKANKRKKQWIKDLVALSLTNFFKKHLPSKLKIGHVFFIWFCLVYYPSWYCPLRNGGGRVRGGWVVVVGVA